MNDKNILIRPVNEADAPAIAAIYAPYVRDTAITFEYEAPTAEEFARRIRETTCKYPYFVAECDGQIVGYCYASAFRTRAAYAFDVESSIYVAEDARGRGVGSALLEALEEALEKMGFVNIYAIITDSTAPDERFVTGESLKFHARHGYVQEGRLRATGYKFERWYDIVFMTKKLRKAEV